MRGRTLLSSRRANGGPIARAVPAHFARRGKLRPRRWHASRDPNADVRSIDAPEDISTGSGNGRAGTSRIVCAAHPAPGAAACAAESHTRGNRARTQQRLGPRRPFSRRELMPRPLHSSQTRQTSQFRQLERVRSATVGAGLGHPGTARERAMRNSAHAKRGGSAPQQHVHLRRGDRLDRCVLYPLSSAAGPFAGKCREELEGCCPSPGTSLSGRHVPAASPQPPRF